MADSPNSILVPEHARLSVENEIERLIGMLDTLDPDPDLEDNGDGEPDADGEPSLGWTEMEARFGRYGDNVDDLEAEADDEPELGSLEQMNQTRWAKGQDGEPSLGSLDCVNQLQWSAGGIQELEVQCEDEGAQSEDEGSYDQSTCERAWPCGPISLGRAA